MESKFNNDLNNESVLLKLMINNGLKNILFKEWYNIIDVIITEEDQNKWIDLKVIKNNKYQYNIDLKTRFTIPIYSPKIDKTFALEIKNCHSKKIGWFIDKDKETDYYLLVYPILNKELSDNNRDYKIQNNWNIWENNKVIWVMSQLISVEKIREKISSFIDKEKLVNFINNSDKLPIKWKAIKLDRKFNVINNTRDESLYFMYSPYLNERPLNLIVKQSIYNEVQDYEFYLPFKL